MLRCPAAAPPSPVPAYLRSETPSAGAPPSRRCFLQTSMKPAAALFWLGVCAACEPRPAQARVLKIRKGGAGERDVIVLSSGERSGLLDSPRGGSSTRPVTHGRCYVKAVRSVPAAPTMMNRTAMDACTAGLAGVMVADLREGHGSSIRCAPAHGANTASHRVQQACS